MNKTTRHLFRLRIIGYFNIFVIFLGLTRFRIDFIAQRVIHSRFIAFYVICANITFLAFMPVSYIYEIIDTSSRSTNNLIAFTDSVNLLINFVAIAFSVLLRGQREGIHLEIAESIIALDRNYFNKICSDWAVVDHRADYLLCFKMFALPIQTFASLYDSFQNADELYANEVLQGCYYSYVQSILAAGLFMYCYLMWLIRKRFCLLNIIIKDLLCQLQQLTMESEHEGVLDLAQQSLVAHATEILIEISQIHARLSRLLVRLNADYKLQILALLMTNLIDSIFFGYYFILAMNDPLYFEFDFETLLFYAYVALLFIDLNLVYWISDMTMDSHEKMPQILRRFQILPLLGDEFEKLCELFALQLQQQRMNTRIAGSFQLNRKSALALWTFALTHVIVLVQFDFGSRRKKNSENEVLDRFNKLFRINGY